MVLAKVKEGKGTFGYNAATGDYGDMLEMGILDPTKVTRLALQNAASVAGLLLTTEVMVAEAPKDEAEHGMARRAAWVAWVAWACNRPGSGLDRFDPEKPRFGGAFLFWRRRVGSPGADGGVLPVEFRRGCSRPGKIVPVIRRDGELGGSVMPWWVG